MIILDNRYKVFIVDDSVFIRNSMMDLLPELGFEIVGMADNSKDAFKYVAETRPDIVLLDTSLDINTEDILRGLLSINKNLEIIIMSPLSNQKHVMKLLRRGAADYIPKPLVASQVEYVLRTYEFSTGIRPASEIQLIAQIHSLFYNEILQHSPDQFDKFIRKAVTSPLKRLSSKYPNRYKIVFNPIRITILQNAESNDKIFKMYVNQLNRLYKSVANRLNKEFPIEYVYSILTETYQSFYPLAKHLIDATNYELPSWQKHTPHYWNPNIINDSRIDFVYEEDYNQYLIPEKNGFDINKRIQPYRMVIHYDPRLAPRFPRTNQNTDMESVDLHIVLSYFDDIIGPKASLIVPLPHTHLEKDKLQSIPRLLDMVGAGPGEPFMHAANDYGSVNIIFSINLKGARGGYRDYMISVVVSPVDVHEMVKINQMSSVLRAISAEITNYYQNNPQAATIEKSSIVATEPQKILNELLEETKDYIGIVR